MFVLNHLMCTRKFKWTMSIAEAMFPRYYVNIQVLPCTVRLVCHTHKCKYRTRADCYILKNVV